MSTSLRAARRVRVKDDVLAVLREAILGGEFAPGEHLGEAELADRLEVSRGPVRDALATLAHEGLVLIEPHKGARVPLLSRRDVEEVYSLRLALEVLAGRQAIRHATEADLEALNATLGPIETALASNDRRAVTDADLRFHDAFYRAAHHQRLHTAWQNLRSQVSLCLFSRNTVASTGRDVVLDEHANLIKQLADRNEAGLVDAISDHLTSAFDRLARHYPD